MKVCGDWKKKVTWLCDNKRTSSNEFSFLTDYYYLIQTELTLSLSKFPQALLAM